MQGALTQLAQAVYNDLTSSLTCSPLAYQVCGEAKYPVLQRVVVHCTLPGPDVMSKLPVGNAYGRMGKEGPHNGST